LVASGANGRQRTPSEALRRCCSIGGGRNLKPGGVGYTGQAHLLRSAAWNKWGAYGSSSNWILPKLAILTASLWYETLLGQPSPAMPRNRMTIMCFSILPRFYVLGQNYPRVQIFHTPVFDIPTARATASNVRS
jgi:hypothetical protein